MDRSKLATLAPTETTGPIDRMRPDAILRWALREFDPDVAVGTGLGPEGMVIVDLIGRMGLPVRVFVLDTGRLPQETHDLMQRVRDRYGIEIETYAPQPERVREVVQRYGTNMFYKSVALRKLCCRVRKVEPLQRALTGLRAWITGLRRTDGPTRAGVHTLEIDRSNGGLYKINPLAWWSREDVWRYLRRNDVPYNALHDRGYPSIGCAPCTRAVRFDEDERAGRWWWEASDVKECGLHWRTDEQGAA